MSLFHKLKKSVVSVTNNPNSVFKDPKFDEANANFDKFVLVITTLKQQIEDGQMRMRAYCESLAIVSGEFLSVFKSANDDKHLYAGVASSSKKKMDELAKDSYDQIVQFSGDTVTLKLAELVDRVSKLKARVVERENQRTEMDYYTSKVTALHEKHKKLKQIEEPKDKEKRERNEQKMIALQQNFHITNQSLMDDMNACWTLRLNLLGPILSDFLAVQRKFADFLQTSCVQESIIVPSTALLTSHVQTIKSLQSGNMAGSISAPATAKNDSPKKDTSAKLVIVRALFKLETDDPENLQFSEGDLIRIVPQKDVPDVDWSNPEAGPDWLTGVLMAGESSKEGQFPRTYVELVKEGAESAATPAAAAAASATAPANKHGATETNPVYLRALFDLKTDDPENLVFEEGDVVLLLTPEVNFSKPDLVPDWLHGRLMHSDPVAEGQFPKTYVRLISGDSEEEDS